jgi:hypothetical protein
MTAIDTRSMQIGWKLFEVAELGAGDYPRTLVHGMPRAEGSPFIMTNTDLQLGVRASGRSRLFPLEQVIPAEPGSKGFNLFPDLPRLVEYLPRFRVRAPRLAACPVYYTPLPADPKSNYALASAILIGRGSWELRHPGRRLLN